VETGVKTLFKGCFFVLNKGTEEFSTGWEKVFDKC
jgi:hypothetical protein